MASRRTRGIKASRWDREESSRAVYHPPSRKGPAGLIFMCNAKTKRDCYHYKVLGLPLAKRDLVEQIAPGTLLFLFDFDVKELYGIYEASSHGGVNLEPKAFEGQGSYPAQVRFEVHRECLPLSEDIFRDAIKENYHSRNRFSIELTSGQVSKLVQLFCPVEPPRKRLHVSNLPAAVHETEGLRRGLPGGAIPAGLPGGAIPARAGLELGIRDARLEPVNRDAQPRLPHQALRVEDGLPRLDPLVRVEPPRPLMVETHAPPQLPQIRVLDGRSDQKGLLIQGRMEEVDELALKYLQPGKPTVGNALDPRRWASMPSSVEAPRSIVSLQQEAILRRRALEVELQRRAAADRGLLREPLLVGPDRTIPSLSAIRSQQGVGSGSLRQLIGHLDGRIRR